MSETSYVYGMRVRGFSPGRQPMNGFLESRVDPKRRYHDLLVYNRMLTKEEKRDYNFFIRRRQAAIGIRPLRQRKKGTRRV